MSGSSGVWQQLFVELLEEQQKQLLSVSEAFEWHRNNTNKFIQHQQQQQLQQQQQQIHSTLLRGATTDNTTAVATAAVVGNESDVLLEVAAERADV